jgi:kynureninase
VAGSGKDHGAFVAVQHRDAQGICQKLREQKIKTDVRGEYLRICPDILTTRAELERAASALKSLL